MSADAAAARLEELARAHGLEGDQRRRLGELLELLQADAHAPSGVTAAERAVDVHVADSLAALTLDIVKQARRLADIGAGAGFPGLVLAVALPGTSVELIESQRRKAAFIDAAIGRLGLENARTVATRVEEWAGEAAPVDVVTARALAPQPVVLEYAAPLLTLGGHLVDWRGARSAEQERAAELAASELGLEVVEVRRVAPFSGAEHHHLHVFRKVEPTPARFPRRAGVARKRPLGG